ncbi:OLC1v1026761C2 [Oldenlandia corymbosa var. corymbosa]|uniref:OLC1v1026761C2 n=1 Tax=Oldenlandia corymbosa var. corymbosa TaxID=529605 RepID=A0AAV1CA09_OLDCO|nr:OLC1v1026761C2 [Oldenlandia corymbosa var. corymbosa]
MNLPASFQGRVLPFAQCSSCSVIHFRPLAFPARVVPRWSCNFPANQLSRFGKAVCKMSGTDTEPESGNSETKDRSTQNVEDHLKAIESLIGNRSHKDEEQSSSVTMLESETTENRTETNTGTEEGNDYEVASGSPLPGLKSQQLDESMRISKETIDILKDQVFGFDTFFVTSQEPYEGGVLFKGNLRGQASKSYEKIRNRLQDRFGDQYKLFLLINPEDDQPVAVVVPKITLQPDVTAVPEWFAAGAFGLVTIFTLMLRNVPALQSNFLSTFDNLELLKDGLPGALVTAFVLGAHEISHILVARGSEIKLGVPYFVPSWQIGSFGAITRILNIVKNREDLLKFAAAGPLAGFSLGFLLLLLGFILPPSDGLGTVVDASVFHESFLVGGIAKLLLGDALKEGTAISLNPLVIWSWAGLLINAINSIPAGELDGGRISFALWGRKVMYLPM